MNLKNQNNSNVLILDSLRAFAALSVCLFHFVCTTTGYFQTQWILNLFSIGKYGVQLFFVISGFIIPWSMHHAEFKINHFFKFALKRFSRLEPPYIASFILAIFILWGRDYFLHTNDFQSAVSGQRILLHFGYLIPFFEKQEWLNPVYWTLAIEFQYYFFIALLFIPLIHSNFLLRIIVGVGIIALSFIGTSKFLPYWLPVFYLGICAFMFKVNKISKQEFYLTLFTLLSFCIYRYSIASVVYMIIPIIAILFFNKHKIPGLNFLGKMSYSIYLIHPIIGASFINILSHRYTSDLGKFSVISGGFVITLISAYMMYLLVEKPSKKLSSSIKYKK